MYKSKELNQEFDTRKEMFKAIIANKQSIIDTKKAVMKQADGIYTAPLFHNSKGEALKANTPITEDVTQLKVKAVINTTNFLDSHGDVHLPNIWKKSLSENKNIMHLQEHKMEFAKIISNGTDLNAYTEDMTWKSLGYDYKGKTQALVFDSKVKASRNGFMFNQYKAANVTNHSVGMYYVKMHLAVNIDEDWATGEKETWDKYIDEIVNKEVAIQDGMFWAVTEAKVVEGSAVPIGSNHITPTLSNNKNIEAANSTSQPEADNRVTSQLFTNILKQINN